MTSRFMRAFLALYSCEEGQALVEYALILALVSLGAVVILSTVGGVPASFFSKINADLP